MPIFQGISSASALAERVASTTGAATGIGEAIARVFAAEGAHLFLVDRDQAGCRAVADSLPGAFAFHGDVREAATFASPVAAAIERFQRVDILINNAGIYPRQTFLEMTEHQGHDMQALTLKRPEEHI